MKRNWDMIREVLIEVEALSFNERDHFGYELSYAEQNEDTSKAEHALLLWEGGFISGIDAGSMDGPAIIGPKLTWEGHELLETIRSQAVWERIKSTAQSKGIELTLESVKLIGKSALAWVLAN
ncbi:hypothetical protein D3C77_293110 [compost metagenome]